MSSFIGAWGLKIAGGALVLMGVLCIVLYVGKLRAERSLARAQSHIAELNAAVELQNAAVLRWQDEARAAQIRSAEAIAQVRREAPRVESRARAAEAERPLTGRCETPRAVLEAGL